MPLDVPSPLAALIQWLLADADIIAAVVQRVYGPELPKEEAADQPRKVLVVKYGSGPAPRYGCAQLGSKIIEVWAYGGSTGEADLLSLLVYQKLKFELRRKVVNNTLLHNAVPLNQPVSFRDPNTNSPVQMQSFSLLAAETATS